MIRENFGGLVLTVLGLAKIDPFRPLSHTVQGINYNEKGKKANFCPINTGNTPYYQIPRCNGTGYFCYVSVIMVKDVLKLILTTDCRF